jgi:hypothetical protein
MDKVKHRVVRPKEQVQYAVYRLQMVGTAEQWFHLMTWREEVQARVYRRSYIRARNVKPGDIRIFKTLTTFEELEV